MVPRTHGSGLRCAVEKATADTISEATSPTMGRANQAPTFCMIQPRKKYSSPAACNGVMSSTMTSSATQ